MGKLTHNTQTLNLVKGVVLEFNDVPVQNSHTKQYSFDQTTHQLIDNELKVFRDKGIIEQCAHEKGEVISPIFCRKKKSGQVRVIGNFADINECIVYRKFKQDTIKTAVNLIRPNAFLSSIDISDAFFCINVAEESRKYLRFIWEDNLYQFTCLAQGLGSARDYSLN